MSVLEKTAQCPFCRKSTTVELSRVGKYSGLQKVKCRHCRKTWEQDFSDESGDSLHKSAPAGTSLAEFKADFERQFAILAKQVEDVIRKKFGVEPETKSEGPFVTQQLRKGAPSQETALDMMKAARGGAVSGGLHAVDEMREGVRKDKDRKPFRPLVTGERG